MDKLRNQNKMARIVAKLLKKPLHKVGKFFDRVAKRYGENARNECVASFWNAYHALQA